MPIIREVFKMEMVAIDVARYVVLLLEAVSVEDRFSLSESDTHLLRLAVDFLLEYERERLEKETIEGGAALRKLLEAHDSAEQHAGQIFWKLQGKLSATEAATPSLSFASIAAAFPLPTTSPTLIGTHPAEMRRRFDDTKQPVFSWRDSTGNQVLFLTSTTALMEYSESSEFKQFSLSPNNGVVVLLPYDANEWHLSSFLEWLEQQNRVSVLHLPLALTDFLLSLRDWVNERSNPFPIAERAESDKHLQHQVAFYRSRLRSFVSDARCHPSVVTPSVMPKRLLETLARVADKDAVGLAIRQAFETISPQDLGFLVDLRELVMNSKSVWGRIGYRFQLEALVKIDDSQLYAILAGLLDGEGRVEVRPKNSQADAYSAQIGLEVHDNHRGDSPDAVLHVAVTIDHPLLPKLKLRIPLPLEGEKAGIGAALEDLTKFSERGHFLQKLRMLVVGGSGNPARQSQQIMIPAKFEIIQIPYRMLSDQERRRHRHTRLLCVGPVGRVSVPDCTHPGDLGLAGGGRLLKRSGENALMRHGGGCGVGMLRLVLSGKLLRTRSA